MIELSVSRESEVGLAAHASRDVAVHIAGTNTVDLVRSQRVKMAVPRTSGVAPKTRLVWYRRLMAFRAKISD
jgi:hypothetical protein